MEYVPSEPNELLFRKGKEFIVLDLTCFHLKIKKSFINPVKKPVPTTIPLRKVVARKGNKTGYLYYEDDILKRERDIYGEKNFVESLAIRDLLFSTPRFKCKINRIPKGSSVHRGCPDCSSKTDERECTDCKKPTEVIVCEPERPSMSNRKPKYNEPRKGRKSKSRRSSKGVEIENSDTARQTMTAFMSVATLLSNVNLP